MKAVILAAGMGKRMKHHTKNKPKTLVQLRGKPLIFYILESLSSQGIRDIIIVTGFGDKKLREVVGDGNEWKLNIEYVNNPRYDSTNNIYSLSLVNKAVENDGFLIINSDVFFHPQILRRLIYAEQKGIILMVDVEKELGEEEMKVTIENTRIIDIGKEIPIANSDGEYIGLSRIDSEFTSLFFNIIKEVLRDKGTGVFYEEAFKRLIEKGIKVKYTTTNGYPWIEIDTPEDLRKAEAEIASEMESNLFSK